MARRIWIAVSALALVAGCERKPTVSSAAPPPAETPAPAAEPRPPTYPPVEPKPPGSPGALPDDRTPISEAPFSPPSAQGAADVVQRYFAFVESRRYDEARALWSDGGRAGGPNAQAFATRFADYLEYHGLVGAPGQIEGAAGSLYVQIAVQVYGRRKDGRELHELGSATLRRVNDVPGSTPEQRLWRITEVELTPAA